MVEICRRLDGIPLALELAAARLRALPVEEIAARVNDRFRLLASGDRTALPRQKTLRALIDWSHDLLSEPERVLLRRLAVFAGGFTLDAAEAVAAGDEIAAGDVLELLTGLVDKSLVTLDAEAGRYAMLETVRQYAMEKLDASGDGDPVRERHLDFHLAMVEGAAAGLAGPEAAAVARAPRSYTGEHPRGARLVAAGARMTASAATASSTRFVTTGSCAACSSSATALRWIRSRAARPHMPASHADAHSGSAGQICAFMARYAEAQRLSRGKSARLRARRANAAWSRAC